MKLLFLHGLGQGPESWNKVLEALGPDKTTACPDLFGLCGDREVVYPALYSALEDYAGGFAEPVLLCGLSLGAVLALDYAIRCPEKVAGLVLIAPQYKMPRTLLRLQNLVFRLMPERAFAGAGMGKRELIRLTSSMMFLDFRGKLDHVTCPTLILWGKRDAANRRAARELAELIPHGTMREVAGAGHEVNLEAPQELAAAIRAFYERL